MCKIPVTRQFSGECTADNTEKLTLFKQVLKLVYASSFPSGCSCSWCSDIF